MPVRRAVLALVAGAVVGVALLFALSVRQGPKTALDYFSAKDATHRALEGVWQAWAQWEEEHHEEAWNVRDFDEAEKRLYRYVRVWNSHMRPFRRVKFDSEGHMLDGWGRQLRMNESVGFYSVGPNGLDEQGEGDDIAHFAWRGSTLKRPWEVRIRKRDKKERR